MGESGRLAQNIVYFARALRAAGIPVGPGSVLDALEAVMAAGVGTRDDFYWTLHAVFVKRHEHSVLFDQAFRIFFRKRGVDLCILGTIRLGAPATRADLHISISRDGELFLTSRQDGMIRMLVPDSGGTN